MLLVIVAILSLAVATLALARPVSAGESAGCPDDTAHLVTFTWNGSSFAPDGGDAKGVTLAGNQSLAFYTSSQTIAGLVVGAGAASLDVALDFPETVGSVSASDFDALAGAPTTSVGFCVGDHADPSSGAGASVSIDLTKSADCATVEGTVATVSGSITVTAHDDPIRVKTARDLILGPNGEIVSSTSLSSLVGMVVPGQAEVPYEISFNPGDAAEFENFIELTIERSSDGDDRHKYYNARAAFELCDEGEQPASGSITIVKDAVPGSAQDFAFTTTGSGLSSFSLDDDADGTLPSSATVTGLSAGAYTVVEGATTGWTLTSITCSAGGTGDPSTRTASIALTPGAHVTCTFVNTQSGGGQLPGGSGTLGGNPPLPNTAMLPERTGSVPAALAALLMLIGLGAAGSATLAEIRRRR